MAVEVGPTVDSWTDEVAVVVGEADLAHLLERRTSKGGLPGRRPLREGDVFWVFVPGAPASPWTGDPAETLATYAAAGAIVLDMTAAARQAVKHIYHRAQKARSPDAAT